MARDQAFHEYIVGDVLREIPGITSRAMFGGWSLYKDGIIFALIADGELYFKVDDKNRADFEERGSHPFVYQHKGKSIAMSYWLLPEEILENREELSDWINRSAQAKLNSK